MPKLSINQAIIKSYKFEDGEYTVTMKFRKNQIASMCEEGIEFHCNTPVVVAIDRVQVDIEDYPGGDGTAES